jgi:hypothetical protein
MGEWRYNSIIIDLRPEWCASRQGRFIPKERAPGTHWMGRLVGHIAGLDVVEQRKISFLSWDSKLSLHPIAHRYSC